MEPLLERYYFSDELGLVKPEREIFEHVIGDLKVAPERIAFFDDTPVNVEAAREVGMTAIRVDGVEALEAELRHLGIVKTERAP
jgi:putative hydrolase of the HAD superfamily